VNSPKPHKYTTTPVKVGRGASS